MRKLVLLLALVCAVHIAAQSPVNDIRIEGFAGLTFGMEKKEAVEKMEARKLPTSVVEEEDGLLTMTYARHGDVLFQKCDLFFFEDKLFSGIYKSEFKEVDFADKDYKKLHDSLIETYGNPLVETSDCVAWQSPDYRIIMLHFGVNDNAKISLELTYLDRVVATRKAEQENIDL